jgi:hypothetical protein
MIDNNSLEHCVLTKPVPTFVRNALVFLGPRICSGTCKSSTLPAKGRDERATSSTPKVNRSVARNQRRGLHPFSTSDVPFSSAMKSDSIGT